MLRRGEIKPALNRENGTGKIMPNEVRLQRIADRIREILAEMLFREINDPRLANITITDVTVDRELAYANIFISCLEGSVRREEILAGFKHAKGFIRRELANRIDLRSFPQLRFHWDPTPEHADHIEKLINELHQDE
jgi:ribosome-binding factor A